MYDCLSLLYSASGHFSFRVYLRLTFHINLMAKLAYVLVQAPEHQLTLKEYCLLLENYAASWLWFQVIKIFFLSCYFNYLFTLG